MLDPAGADQERALLLWPDGDLRRPPQRWVRRGECLRCGACCQAGRPSYYVAEADELANAEGRAWIQAGVLVVGEDWDGEERRRFWQPGDPMADLCAQYLGAAGCALHGAVDQPESCRKFPLFPPEVARYPHCGYWFIRIG